MEVDREVYAREIEKLDALVKKRLKDEEEERAKSKDPRARIKYTNYVDYKSNLADFIYEIKRANTSSGNWDTELLQSP